MSDSRLAAPKSVFIDTEAYISNNYDFGGRRFRSLLQLVEVDEVEVFSTTVTVREVHSNIVETVMNAPKVKPHKILRNSKIAGVKALFEPVPRGEVRDELLEQFESFLDEGDVEVLEASGESLEQVLDDYFERRPPFGEEKNKAEFPDAIAIDTLKRWCDENDEDMAIITCDKGMASTCREAQGRLRHFDSLSAYLDAVLVPDSEAVHEFVLDMVEQHRDEVFRDLSEEFGDLAVLIVDQIEGDVEYAELLSIDFNDGVEVVRLENGEASIEVPTELEFRADLNYPEEGTAIYDSEEGRTFYPHWVAASVTRTVTRLVELDVKMEGLIPERFKVKKAKFAGAADIEIEAYPYSDWDLK